MHPNEALLHRLFNALNQHNHPTMASCYHSAATFRDIAFKLRNRKEIHSMWHMICEGDIRATFEVVHANDQEGRVKLVDTYTFGATKEPPKPGRPVRNVVDSRFLFQDALPSVRAWAIPPNGLSVSRSPWCLRGRFIRYDN